MNNEKNIIVYNNINFESNISKFSEEETKRPTITDSNDYNTLEKENSNIIYKKKKGGIFNISRRTNKNYIKKHNDNNHKIKENENNENDEKTSDENIDIQLPNNYPKRASTMSRMNNKIKREIIQENYEKLIKLRNNHNNLHENNQNNNDINHQNTVFQSLNNYSTDRMTINDYIIDNTYSYFSKEKKIYLNNFDFGSLLIHNEVFKNYIFKFLNLKNISILSMTNKKIYKVCQYEIYNTFFIQIMIIKNSNLIEKIKRSVFQYSKVTKSTYIDNLYCDNSIYNNLIEKDLTRTFPNDNSFKKGKSNYQKLYSILKSYSNYNKKIGYAQGLNFMAGNALFFFNTNEEISMFIDGMINKFELDKFMGINNNELNDKLNNLGNFLKFYFKKYNKDILTYLEKNYVKHEYFTANWLLTLFSNGMDRNNLLIVWCFLIVFGWKFFYFFILNILIFFGNDIKKSNETKLSSMMKNLLKNEKFTNNFNIIIENTFTSFKNNILI